MRARRARDPGVLLLSLTRDGRLVNPRALEWLIGVHRDIDPDEIATLVLLSAGLLTGGPTGARPRPIALFPNS
jgi:hypothetical protein